MLVLCSVGRVSLTLFDVSSDEDVNVNEEVTQTLRDSELKPSLPQVMTCLCIDIGDSVL